MLEAFIKCVVFLPLAYILRVAAIVLAPFVVWTVNQEGRPWKIFRWIETHDHLGWEGPNHIPSTREITNKWGRHIGLMAWWMRNQAYSAQYHLFSIRFRDPSPPAITRHWHYGQQGRVRVGFWAGLSVVEIDWHKKYFGFHLGYSFPNGFVLYLIGGWKVMGQTTGRLPGGSGGMYTGLTPRTSTIK